MRMQVMDASEEAASQLRELLDAPSQPAAAGGPGASGGASSAAAALPLPPMLLYATPQHLTAAQAEAAALLGGLEQALAGHRFVGGAYAGLLGVMGSPTRGEDGKAGPQRRG